MNVEIESEAAQFPEKGLSINGIFVAVQCSKIRASLKGFSSSVDKRCGKAGYGPGRMMMDKRICTRRT